VSRVLLMSYDRVPAAKGASAHILANASILSERHEVSLLSLGTVPLPHLHHRPLHITEPNWLLRGLELNRRATRFLDRYPFDVHHVRSPFEGLAVPFGRPLIYEVNGLYSIEAPYHFPALARQPSIRNKLRAMERCLLDRAQLVITPSLVTAQYLEDLGVERDRIEVVPNSPSIAPQRRERIEEEHVSLCYAGSLAGWQGVFELVAALPDISPRVRLTVLTSGSKDRVRRLLKLAAKREVAGRLIVRETDPERMGEELQRHDIAIAPLIPCERNLVQGAMPIKLLDYAAAGLPIVAPDMPVVREILGPRYPLYARWSRTAMLRAVGELVDHPELRRELGAMGSSVMETHSPAKQRARLFEAYARLGL
jgi:glycosyltransferase involved in cell wall biosynthesis